MKLHKIAIPCLVRGGYRPHTAPHGGPERRTYFGLLQRAIIAQIFGSKVKPTVNLANLPSKRFASIHRQARCVVQQTTTAAVVASVCNRSNQAPRLASGACAWALSWRWRETRQSKSTPNGGFSAPDTQEVELALCHFILASLCRRRCRCRCRLYRCRRLGWRERSGSGSDGANDAQRPQGGCI